MEKNFRIQKLKNFAAIGKIENDIYLNDLTIFMGDNSAGKSYIAILFDRLINLEKELDNVLRYVDIQNSELYIQISRLVDDLMKPTHDDEDSQNSIEISREIHGEVINSTKCIIEEIIIDFIQKHFKGVISGKLSIQVDYEFKKNLELIIRRSATPTLYEFSIILRSSGFNIEGKHIIEKSKFKKELIIEQILEVIFFVIIKKTLSIPSSIYLPASRTGYLHTYEVLIKYALEKTFGKRAHEVLNLPDWILDFIIKLSQTSKSIDESNEITRLIEHNILNGKVVVSKDTSDIEFFIKNSRGNYKKKIDLPYTSSSVSELIPLVAFLKRGFIKPGQLLIIEEPEAHLSFENQRLIARVIALLVQEGIKVLITTHSDFLIYEINNLILAHAIDKNKRPSEYKRITINPASVNLYNFLFEKGKKKSIVKKVNVTEEGIDNPLIVKNFQKRVEIMDKLYTLFEEANG